MNKEGNKIVEYTLKQVNTLREDFVIAVKGAMINGFRTRVIIEISELFEDMSFAKYADEVAVITSVSGTSRYVYYLAHKPLRAGVLWFGSRPKETI